MSDVYMPGIPYLEISDFNPDNSLKPHVTQGKPTICMVQGAFCGYCTQAKPDFMQMAREVEGRVTACTIQIDSEKDLASVIPKLNPNYQGVPIYLFFDANGKYIRTHDGGRDVKSLISFLMSQ